MPFHRCPSVKASIFGSSADLEAVGRFEDDNPMSLVYNGVSGDAALYRRCANVRQVRLTGWSSPLRPTASQYAHRKARQPRKDRSLNRCHHWCLERSWGQGTPSCQCACHSACSPNARIKLISLQMHSTRIPHRQRRPSIRLSSLKDTLFQSMCPTSFGASSSPRISASLSTWTIQTQPT